ncbi:MAG: H-NS histone family protein [Burkholderiales bacterium]|nr:H-NS histone family protein [Burkholderiales bacterium]
MGNLIEIQTQIEKLQKQAADIKSREFDKTVKDIIARMQAFGITLKDLQSGMGKKGAKARPGRPRGAKAAAGKAATGKTATKRARKPSKQAGTKVAPKYRGPNGEAWSGRGVMPRWLAALVAQGKTRESFAIKG